MIHNLVTDAQLADWYDAAADYIETHGWTQRELYDAKTGGVCASGALCAVIAPRLFVKVAANEPVVMLPEWSQWMEAARRVIEGQSVTGWNDNKARDKYEVIEMFKNAAKELRNA